MTAQSKSAQKNQNNKSQDARREQGNAAHHFERKDRNQNDKTARFQDNAKAQSDKKR